MVHVSASVTLAKSVMGRQLMEAARQVAGQEYHEELDSVIDGKKSYLVGQASQYSSRDLIIRANEQQHIDPDAEYSHVVVENKGWRGMKYAVIESDNDYVEAVEEFAAKLTAALVESKTA